MPYDSEGKFHKDHLDAAGADFRRQLDSHSQWMNDNARSRREAEALAAQQAQDLANARAEAARQRAEAEAQQKADAVARTTALDATAAIKKARDAASAAGKTFDPNIDVPTQSTTPSGNPNSQDLDSKNQSQVLGVVLTIALTVFVAHKGLTFRDWYWWPISFLALWLVLSAILTRHPRLRRLIVVAGIIAASSYAYMKFYK